MLHSASLFIGNISHDNGSYICEFVIVIFYKLYMLLVSYVCGNNAKKRTHSHALYRNWQLKHIMNLQLLNNNIRVHYWNLISMYKYARSPIYSYHAQMKHCLSSLKCSPQHEHLPVYMLPYRRRWEEQQCRCF